jgi:hypothetical protein
MARQDFGCLTQARWRFDRLQAHAAFDRLAGTQPESRDRADRIPKRLIDTVETWLKAKEIEDVEWSNMCIAHAAD